MPSQQIFSRPLEWCQQMPIRNSKVPSGEVFARHRQARLTNLQPPSDTGAVEQSVDKRNADRETNAPSPAQPDQASERKSDRLPVKQSEAPTQKPHHEEKQSEAPSEPERSEASISGLSRKKSANAAVQRGEAGQIQLQMALAYPAPGASPTIDQLASVESERVAFRLVLGNALKAYANAVTDGTKADAPTTYPEGPRIVKTSRMFPKAAYAELVKALNPTGLLSDRSMGTTIGRRALAAFVAHDKGSA